MHNACTCVKQAVGLYVTSIKQIPPCCPCPLPPCHLQEALHSPVEEAHHEDPHGEPMCDKAQAGGGTEMPSCHGSGGPQRCSHGCTRLKLTRHQETCSSRRSVTDGTVCRETAAVCHASAAWCSPCSCRRSYSLCSQIRHNSSMVPFTVEVT
jgi:hypothetical protein